MGIKNYKGYVIETEIKLSNPGPNYKYYKCYKVQGFDFLRGDSENQVRKLIDSLINRQVNYLLLKRNTIEEAFPECPRLRINRMSNLYSVGMKQRMSSETIKNKYMLTII